METYHVLDIAEATWTGDEYFTTGRSKLVVYCKRENKQVGVAMR